MWHDGLGEEIADAFALLDDVPDMTRDFWQGMHEVRREDPEAAKARKAAWLARNPEYREPAAIARARKARWREENRAHHNAAELDRYRANRDEINRRKREAWAKRKTQ